MWRERRAKWETDYRVFARMRGFETFNDLPYHRRGFIECWAEAGFHRFWRTWNPGIAYFVYKMYLRMGGRRHWSLATLGAFLANGLVHTVVVAPFAGRWSWVLIVTFGCFGILTILSRYLAPYLKQYRWPRILNAMINIGLVVGSFDLGFKVDRLL